MSDFFCRRVFRSCLCAHFPYMHYVTISANQNQRLTMIYAYGRHSQKNDSEGSFELSAKLERFVFTTSIPPQRARNEISRLNVPPPSLGNIVTGFTTTCVWQEYKGAAAFEELLRLCAFFSSAGFCFLDVYSSAVTALMYISMRVLLFYGHAYLGGVDPKRVCIRSS